MGVELHIKRTGGPISLEEWNQTVQRRTDLKFQTEDLVAVNPTTGEQITIPPAKGSTLLLVDGNWLPSFYWSHGEIVFKALPPAQKVAEELAASLEAEILTDDGEPLQNRPFSSTQQQGSVPLGLGGSSTISLLAVLAAIVLVVFWRKRRGPQVPKNGAA